MPNEPYSSTREDLAKIVACHISGLKDALPEQDDFDLADKLIEFIERDVVGE